MFTRDTMRKGRGEKKMLMQSCCLVVCFIDQQTDGVVTVGKNSPRILRQPEFLYCLSESYTFVL